MPVNVSGISRCHVLPSRRSMLAGRLTFRWRLVPGSHTLTDCRSEGRVYTAFAPGACYLGGSGGDGGQAGIVGFISAGARLERCVNAGEVYAGRAAGVGGIVGSAGSSGTEVTLSQCANQGAVSNDTAAVLLNKGGTGGVLMPIGGRPPW